MLYEYARMANEQTFLGAAQFIHKELPIRIARKVKELEHIPGDMVNHPAIKTVREWYYQSLVDIVEFPYPKDAAGEEAFMEVVNRVKDRHKNQVMVMGRGIQDYVKNLGPILPGSQMQEFLDRFYLSRIGIRVLIGHHVSSHTPQPGWVGIICAQTSPLEVAQDAARNAADICRMTYGDPPEVEFHGRLNLRFKYIPSHLHHIFFELFKNSFRATIEAHKGKGDPPPVRVVIAGGMEDVAIKVSDVGGGIPRSGIDRIWTYAYTTAQNSPGPYMDEGDIMAGLGYGLPLSRLYARYFGGDLQVISLEGYGTDAYIHLSRLGTRAEFIA